jgi:hypothetical protein
MRPLCGVAVPVSDTNTLPWFERAIPIGRLSPDVTVVPGHNCARAGVSRAEPSIDIIQEVQIQSVGVSAEYGNIQGTVFNVVTRQGSNRLLYDASYYAQASSLTAQPVLLPVPVSQSQSGYERARYRDFTTNLGGPVRRDRLWFFGAISTCGTTTVNRAPTRSSQELTNRTRSSRSSRGT